MLIVKKITLPFQKNYVRPQRDAEKYWFCY